MMPLFVLPAIAPADAPVQPGWWPLPPGWWLLGMAVFVLSIWLLAALLRRLAANRRYIPPDTRTLALAALDELEHRKALGEREVAFRLNEILWAALFDPHGSGGWRPFMPRDDLGLERQEWDVFWTELEARYKPLTERGEGRQRAWIATARKWIEHLPDRDGIRMYP